MGKLRALNLVCGASGEAPDYNPSGIVECTSCGKQMALIEAECRRFNRGRCGKCGGPIFPLDEWILLRNMKKKDPFAPPKTMPFVELVMRDDDARKVFRKLKAGKSWKFTHWKRGDVIMKNAL